MLLKNYPRGVQARTRLGMAGPSDCFKKRHRGGAVNKEGASMNTKVAARRHRRRMRQAATSRWNVYAGRLRTRRLLALLFAVLVAVGAWGTAGPLPGLGGLSRAIAQFADPPPRHRPVRGVSKQQVSGALPARLNAMRERSKKHWQLRIEKSTSPSRQAIESRAPLPAPPADFDPREKLAEAVEQIERAQ